MNSWMVALVFLLAQITPTQQPVTISGSVLDRETGLPVRGQSLSLGLGE